METCQLRTLPILLQLEAVGHFAETFVLHVAFLENERGILLHLLPSLLPLLVGLRVDLDLLGGHHFFALQLDMQLNSLTSLLSDNVIKLACEVFARERKVLGEDNLAEDMLTVGALDPLLVLICESLVNSLWLLGNYLIKH